MNYLIFRLYAPMASWGGVAIGEARHSESHPTKSAITGLLAAALGLRREEEEQQRALVAACKLAVKQFRSGDFMQDYHTAQAADSVGKFTYRTRRDEVVLGKDRLGTIISTREYRLDSLHWVAVTLADNAAWTLEALRDALLRPHYHLYLGRKSCPLAAPLEPRVVKADTFREAFDKFTCVDVLPAKTAARKQPIYFWEGSIEDMDAQLDHKQVQTLTRRDQPLSRRQWQFRPRLEFTYSERGPR